MRLERLRNIADNPAVALLADHYEDDWTALWWARATGSRGCSTPATPRRRTPAPLGPLAARYPQYRDAPPPGTVIAVDVTRWSGWAGAAALTTAYAGSGATSVVQNAHRVAARGICDRHSGHGRVGDSTSGSVRELVHQDVHRLDDEEEHHRRDDEERQDRVEEVAVGEAAPVDRERETAEVRACRRWRRSAA